MTRRATRKNHFSCDAEYFRPMRWVAPCKCRGDTRWVHETCLVRFILTRPSEEDLRENENDNDQDQNEQNNDQDDVRSRKIVRGRVRCPQCQATYKLRLGSVGVVGELVLVAKETMDALWSFTSPYVLGLSAGAVFLLAGVSQGMYACIAFCGNDDPLVLSLLRKGSLGAGSLLLLGCVPAVSLLSAMPSTQRSLSFCAASTLALMSSSCALPPQTLLARSFTPPSPSTSALWLTVYRTSCILSALTIRPFYSFIMKTLFKPRKPANPLLATIDNEVESIITPPMTISTVLQHISYSLFFPSIASFSGSLLKSFTRNHFKLDTFLYSFYGGIAFTLGKDLMNQWYKYYRRKEARMVRVCNFQ